MNFKSVLIVTYGRSGSTLLQGLLNSIDGCLIRGENHNLCYGLFLAYGALCKTEKSYGNYARAEQPVSPWFGASNLDEEVFISDARRLVMHQLLPRGKAEPSPDCFGFKEIRYLPSYFRSGRSDIAEYLDFLTKLFPNPALITLGRDHQNVLKSGWWKEKDPDEVKNNLLEFESGIKAYAQGKSWIFPIRYEDLTGRTDRLKQLYEFLGVPFEAEVVDRVLSTRHSYEAQKSPPDAREREVEVLGSSALRLLTVDNIKETSMGSIVLGGVAVLKGDLSFDDYVITVRYGERECAVKWGQPSPAIARKYPGNVNSGRSRFVVEGIPTDVPDPITLYLVDREQNSEAIAKIGH